MNLAQKARARVVKQEVEAGKSLNEVARVLNIDKLTVKKDLEEARRLNKHIKSEKVEFFEKLRQKARELNGLTPTRVDINQDERFENSNFYANRYGSWSKICREAGLEANKGSGSCRGYNPELDSEGVE